MKKNLKNFLFLTRWYLFWLVGVLLVSLLAMKFLAFKPSFPYWDAILQHFSQSQFIWQWANFDGVHYLTIAKKGYVGTGLIQAFFPFYPLVIRLINKLIGNFLYSGLLVSNFFFLLALFFFNQLIKLERMKNKKWAFLFLFLFPTSFYFICLYTESLFLFLSVLTFLLIRKKNWFLAAIFASLASMTRLVGVFLGFALVWEYYQFLSKKKQKKPIFLAKSLFLGFVSVTGLLLFCSYLNRVFGNPFYFVQVQHAFGASRQTDKIILFYQVIWRYLKMLATIRGNNFLLYTISQEFFLSLFVLGVLIFGWIKKVKKSYLIYSFLSFFLPTMTGNLSSMPRYTAVLFPIYLILAQIKNKKFKYLILVIFLFLLIINISLFVRGYWVA